jgi:hypothetical protein
MKQVYGGNIMCDDCEFFDGEESMDYGYCTNIHGEPDEKIYEYDEPYWCPLISSIADEGFYD